MKTSVSNNRKLTVAAAALLLMAGAPGMAVAQQGAMDHGGASHGAGEHSQHQSGASADAQADRSEHGGGHGGKSQGGCAMMGSGSGGMDHGGMDHGAKESGGGMMKRVCGTAEHVEGRLAYLKAELKPTEAQTQQWNAFADAFRASGQKIAQHCASSKEHGGHGGVLQQFGMMERNMTAHLESVRTIKAAAEPLFAVLTEEQKKIAEETMTGVMGLGMGMGKH